MLHNSHMKRSILVLLILFGSASLAFAQGGSIKSENQVMLRVTAPNGTWAIANVFEGEMLTMVYEKTNSGFGFSPVINNAKDRVVEVRVFPIGQDVPETKPGEALQITTGSPKTTASSFKVELLAISRHLPEEAKRAHAKASAPFQNCCVNCGGIRICANCSVSTECGCCCTGRDACCQICQ